MNLTAPIQATYGQIYSDSTVQRYGLGTLAITRDGRLFRYCKAGGSSLVVGNVIQSPAQIANHQQLVPSAAPIGANQIVATLGATAATENQYAEGLAIIDTTPGLGYPYGVSGHAAVLSGGVITLNLPLDELVQVALTGTSRVSLQVHPYRDVIQHPIAATCSWAGVAVHPIPSGSFGWLQTRGPCGVLIDGTPAVGTPVRPSGAVAGAVAALVVTTATAIPAAVVGNMMVTGVNTKVQAVFLTLD